MQFNLLKQNYDLQCELFINGQITWVLFTQLEQEYFKRKHLFIICLN